MIQNGKKLSIEELTRPTVKAYRHSKKIPVIVVLDNVRSLHNVGSVFRTCDAFAIEAIYLCGITATPPNREIHKTALGATESVEWKYWRSTKEAAEHLKSNGSILVASEQVAGSQGPHNLSPLENQRYAIVFGNEVYGISDDVLRICDNYLEIPQVGTKHSLNVAVSAGIVLWEFFKALKKGT